MNLQPLSLCIFLLFHVLFSNMECDRLMLTYRKHEGLNYPFKDKNEGEAGVIRGGNAIIIMEKYNIPLQTYPGCDNSFLR